MKKIILASIVPLFFFHSVYSQNSTIEVNGGLLFPQDMDNGIIVGISKGQIVDENIGWAFEANYFWRTFTKDRVVKSTGGTTTSATEIENSTKMLPVMFKIIYLSQIAPKLDLRISGGLGYTFLWNNDTNYKLNIENSGFFTGFAWQIGAGVSLPLTRASDVFGELSYFGSTPSTDEGETTEGLPLRTEIDMSGLYMRLGIRLYH